MTVYRTVNSSKRDHKCPTWYLSRTVSQAPVRVPGRYQIPNT